MQQGCVDLQRQSHDSLPGSVTGLPDDVGAGILRSCKAQYPGDFFMQNGCAQLQVQSWRSLNE